MLCCRCSFIRDVYIHILSIYKEGRRRKFSTTGSELLCNKRCQHCVILDANDQHSSNSSLVYIHDLFCVRKKVSELSLDSCASAAPTCCFSATPVRCRRVFRIGRRGVEGGHQQMGLALRS